MEYCERTDAGFWAEPVNALTNLAFLLAALAIARALYRADRPLRETWDLWLLALLVAAIGVGSFLWHTLATPWSALADVIPILLFINGFLLVFLVRVAGLGRLGWLAGTAAVSAWFVLFHALNYAVATLLPADLLNGSEFYLPTWAALWIMAAYCWTSGHRNRHLMLGAGLAFTASLTLRSVDNTLCPAWSPGTHFGWHLLNGLVLYLATLALLVHRNEFRPAGVRGSARAGRQRGQ
jgi:hypothetical protein